MKRIYARVRCCFHARARNKTKTATVMQLFVCITQPKRQTAKTNPDPHKRPIHTDLFPHPYPHPHSPARSPSSDAVTRTQTHVPMPMPILRLRAQLMPARTFLLLGAMMMIIIVQSFAGTWLGRWSKWIGYRCRSGSVVPSHRNYPFIY